jgi:hypothetical protein
MRRRNPNTLRAQYAHNILNVYYAADSLSRAAGAEWYRVEGERCAEFGKKHGVTREAVAGAAAAISPGMRWELVFSHLAALLKDSTHRVPTYSREFVRRAVECLNGASPLAVLRGDKTRAFYRLLAYDSGYPVDADPRPVVVDGHAVNIARGAFAVFRKRPGYTPPAACRVWPARYRLVADAYRMAAEVAEVPPHEMQAATWIYWKSIHA